MTKLTPHPIDEPTVIELAPGDAAVVFHVKGDSYAVEAHLPAASDDDVIQVGSGFHAAMMVLALHGDGNEDLLAELRERFERTMEDGDGDD